MNVQSGFFLERLVVSGPELPDAVLEFADGLNVVAGASNTGKSYAFSCIDYALGAGRPPKTIKESAGYHSLLLRIVARHNGESYEITRSLAGGEIELKRLARTGELIETKTLAAKHDADDANTISGFLLQLSGLWGRHLRTNQRGDRRSLSFRDVAYLILVDENRILAERPPQFSELAQDNPAEADALRLLVTGHESAPVIGLPSKKLLAKNKAKSELLEEMIVSAEIEFASFGVAEDSLEGHISQVEVARNAALMDYDVSRTDIVELETKLADAGRLHRDGQARALVVDGLEKRFRLLYSHYESDLNRLQTIEETGVLLEAFPSKSCPVCGAAPDHHRAKECAMEYRLDDVRAAARSESERIVALKTDLARTLADLTTEAGTLEKTRLDVAGAVQAMQVKIANELMPRVRQSTEALRAHTDRRDHLVRAQNVAAQLKQLRTLAAPLEAKKIAKPSASAVETMATTAELDAFAAEAGALLKEWHYPDMGRVVFSEDEQDLVIGGQVHTANGKGVRALTCAAFILGVSRHCQQKGLPHPALVILDSPLFAYKEPDSGSVSAEDEKLRQAGVKEAFYSTLAQGGVGGQIIIFENSDPPSEVREGLKRQHFTKSDVGRYGFFSLSNS